MKFLSIDTKLLFCNNHNNELLISTNIGNDCQINPFINIKTQFCFSMTNSIDKSIHKLNNGIYHENTIIYNRPNKDENIIDLKLEERQDIKNIIHLINEKSTPFKSDFFKPDKFFISFNDQKLYKGFSPESVNIMSLIESFEKDKNFIMLLKFTNLLYLVQLTNEYHKYMGTPKLGEELDLNEITEQEIDEFIKNIDYKRYRIYILHELEQISQTNEISRIEELNRAFQFFGFLHSFEDFIISYVGEFEINIKEFIKKDFIDKMPNYFEFDFVSEENIRFNNLSTGEQDSLKIFYSIKDLIRKRDYLTDNYYILLDEIGNSLHPNWQKKLINDLILLFDLYKDKTFHLIMTTHSPFILSDLPKENVIFLKDGKQIDALEKKQTFGANIHTLLSDGFFMDGGLMGEFAKSKINDVIKYLKREESIIQSDKEAKNIIDIIGEPILKNTLMTMYDEKIYSKESKLDKLNRKKLQLEKEIKELEEKPSE